MQINMFVCVIVVSLHVSVLCDVVVLASNYVYMFERIGVGVCDAQ